MTRGALWYCCCLLILLTCERAKSQAYIGDDGIRSEGLRVDGVLLDGSDVIIGQIEPDRAGKFEFDDDSLTIDFVTPAQVYIGTGNGAAGVDTRVDSHATQVAEVMISQEGGVARNANLYSGTWEAGDLADLEAINRMAQRGAIQGVTGDRVRAINLSYAKTFTGLESPDGNSTFTSMIDWSASEHDVTYVTAWSNERLFNRSGAPSDNYNGITVGPASRPLGIEPNDINSVWFDQTVAADPVTDSQLDAAGPRTSIDILAPGRDLPILDPATDTLVPDTLNDGSSFAAPHVTGAVALLQQYAAVRSNNGAMGFGNDARRHQVMKAVIMNSADKLDGVHGADRNILSFVNNVPEDWRNLSARTNPNQPLDPYIGVGHLNVERAIEQYSSGQMRTGNVGDVGWSQERSGGVGDAFEYDLPPVNDGDWVAVTLVWDRMLDKTGDDDNYRPGDMFINPALENSLSDLNLQIIRVDDMGGETVVASSTSDFSSVEHIFTNDLGAGDGELMIRVKHDGDNFSKSEQGFGRSLDAQTEFALAWWSFEPTSITPGDFDGDGEVDLDDRSVWTSNFGASVFPGRLADGNLDGVINAADYTVWRDAFNAASAVAVPEPTSVILLLTALASLRRRA